MELFPCSAPDQLWDHQQIALHPGPQFLPLQNWDSNSYPHRGSILGIYLILLKHACMLRYFSLSDSLRPSGLQPTRLFCPWDSPAKNAGVGCHGLLQGIFPDRGTELVSLMSLALVPYHQCHLGSPDNINRKHLSECWAHRKHKCQPGLQQFSNSNSVSAPHVSHDHRLQHSGL